MECVKHGQGIIYPIIDKLKTTCKKIPTEGNVQSRPASDENSVGTHHTDK